LVVQKSVAVTLSCLIMFIKLIKINMYKLNAKQCSETLLAEAFGSEKVMNSYEMDKKNIRNLTSRDFQLQLTHNFCHGCPD